MPAYPVSTGFWGKLPARGDFVRSGLSRAFTDAWDGWMAGVLTGSRALLEDEWQQAWLVAPVWRFCLRPGLCGPLAAVGLWMPSVDRAGRAYPLMFAAEFAGIAIPGPAATAWLDEAEATGRAALSEGLIPQSIAARLPAMDSDAEGVAPSAASWWWSEGSVTIPPDEMCLRAMPDAERFAVMMAGERGTDGGGGRQNAAAGGTA